MQVLTAADLTIPFSGGVVVQQLIRDDRGSSLEVDRRETTKKLLFRRKERQGYSKEAMQSRQKSSGQQLVVEKVHVSLIGIAIWGKLPAPQMRRRDATLGNGLGGRRLGG